MRILSVVTLVSPNGEYGGPLRVAINQCTALAERGHDVTIAASARQVPNRPHIVEGLPARLFTCKNAIPRSGFAGLAAPALWAWVARSAKEFDVVHVHAARDLVTLPAARALALQKRRYVVQAHGMIDPSARTLAKPLDALMTLPVLHQAHRVLYLTESERAGLEEVAGIHSMQLMELPNGVPDAPTRRPEKGAEIEVLFLARLAARKRPRAFVSAATALSREFPEVRFTLIGPDEGEGEAVSQLIQQARLAGAKVSWEGPMQPASTIDRMLSASVYALPAIDEPYPMAVLEAMSVGLPVIVTNSCGLSRFVQSMHAGLIVDAEEASFVSALRLLLSNAELRMNMGLRARNAVREHLSMDAIAAGLENAYA